MASNPVEKKLAQIIVPYLISAEHLPKHFLYRTYGCYAMFKAYIAALVGFGLAPQTFVWYNQLLQGGEKANQLALPMSATALLVGLILVGVSVYYSKQNAETRAILAKTCKAELLEVGDELEAALQSPSPVGEITKLQNQVVAIVKRYRRQSEAWPWDRFAVGIEADVQARIDDLSKRFGPWQLALEREEP